MKVAIQGICYDEKSSFQRGPAKAPGLIRERFWSDAYNRFAENGIEITKALLTDFGDHHIEDYEEIGRLTSKHITDHQRLLTLGGDHSITYPVVRSYVERYVPLNLLHIDAHGDLYDSFEGDPYSHACPFARIMEDGLVSRLVQIGIRTLNDHQRQQAERYNVEIYEMKDYSGEVPEFDGPVYLSLDIDGIDPAFAPGVSHQESAGLTPRQVLHIIQNLNAPIMAADLVEYNPDNDIGGITSALCAKMMKEILAGLLRST